MFFDQRLSRLAVGGKVPTNVGHPAVVSVYPSLPIASARDSEYHHPCRLLFLSWPVCGVCCAHPPRSCSRVKAGVGWPWPGSGRSTKCSQGSDWFTSFFCPVFAAPPFQLSQSRKGPSPPSSSPVQPPSPTKFTGLALLLPFRPPIHSSNRILNLVVLAAL